MMRLPVNLFRYPARVVPLAAVAICALATIGCDRMIRNVRWQIVIALLIFADVVLQVQPLLVTARFNPRRVTYPPSIGRDSKLVRVGIKPNFDRDAWISGYLNLYDRRFDGWTASPIVSRRYTSMYRTAVASHDLAAIDSLSGGYIVAPGILKGFELRASSHGAFVHRNAAALPLAYLRSDPDHRIAAVRTLAFTNSAVFIDVDAPFDGDVVVTQQAVPGWSVTVDGNPATPHEISLFKAVRVTRGRHAIKWTYRPPFLIIGAFLTLAALVRLLLPHMFVKRIASENFLRVSLKIA
jgi:hypothetical protein